MRIKLFELSRILGALQGQQSSSTISGCWFHFCLFIFPANQQKTSLTVQRSFNYLDTMSRDEHGRETIKTELNQ